MPNRPIRATAADLSRVLVVATALLLTLVATACAGTNATSSPSNGQSSTSPGASSNPSVSPGPTVGAIEHATGATDVILRLDQGGGFVPIEFLVAQAPAFTLFGNGVIVFQPEAPEFPQPDVNGVVKGIPWRTASLDEGQIQELLEYALGQGGLGAARASYAANGVADALDTIFTIHAGGLDKTVTVNALGMDTQGSPDAVARTSFSKLAERLQDFDRGGSIGSDVYSADRYRGVLTARDTTGGAPLPWPWPAVTPADFKQGASSGLPRRAMSAAEVAMLGLTGIEGGVQGVTLNGPDGKTYGFILRPLLGDETE